MTSGKRIIIGLAFLCLLIVLSGAKYSGIMPIESELPFCYPNPFSSADTSVKFVIKPRYDGPVDIKIFTVSGLLVRRLYFASAPNLATADTDLDEFSWDGLNYAGMSIASGAYIFVIYVTDSSSTNVDRYIGKCFKY